MLTNTRRLRTGTSGTNTSDDVAGAFCNGGYRSGQVPPYLSGNDSGSSEIDENENPAYSRVCFIFSRNHTVGLETLYLSWDKQSFLIYLERNV